jgi:acyl carrier protein
MATDPGSGYEHEVKQLLIDRLGLDLVADEIPDDASLIDAFGLDSAGIFTTVMALEEHFDIEIDDAELTNDAFSSVAALAALVRSKAA